MNCCALSTRTTHTCSHACWREVSSKILVSVDSNPSYHASVPPHPDHSSKVFNTDQKRLSFHVHHLLSVDNRVIDRYWTNYQGFFEDLSLEVWRSRGSNRDQQEDSQNKFSGFDKSSLVCFLNELLVLPFKESDLRCNWVFTPCAGCSCVWENSLHCPKCVDNGNLNASVRECMRDVWCYCDKTHNGTKLWKTPNANRASWTRSDAWRVTPYLRRQRFLTTLKWA